MAAGAAREGTTVLEAGGGGLHYDVEEGRAEVTWIFEVLGSLLAEISSSGWHMLLTLLLFGLLFVLFICYKCGWIS